jgi:hypothetical protein
MGQVAENLQQLKSELPEGVRLVAISKTKPTEAILEAYHTGHRLFGENKVQELIEKQAQLPEDIEWHMVGHLQRNKVKYIAPFVSLIHSVDSLRLLQEINKQAKKNNREIDCLLQVHIASEESKFGFDENEVNELFASQEFSELDHVRVCGLMGMATFTDDETAIRNEFKRLATLQATCKEKYFSSGSSFSELSMGMSNDYPIAIEEGSTLIRVGSQIFGVRHCQYR